MQHRRYHIGILHFQVSYHSALFFSVLLILYPGNRTFLYLVARRFCPNAFIQGALLVDDWNRKILKVQETKGSTSKLKKWQYIYSHVLR